MAGKVFDVKLQKEGDALDRAPFPNALGQKILGSISKESWQLWLAHSTMLINEYRMDLTDPRDRTKLLDECEKFFFGEGSEAPPDFKPEDPK